MNNEESNSGEKFGSMVKECINQLLWASRPRKDKLYRIYKELKDLGYSVGDVASFNRRAETYYDHRTERNQAKLIREVLFLPASSEVSRVLALDFRSGEVDAKRLMDASRMIYHQLRFQVDTKKYGIDEPLIYNALKRLVNPSHVDKTQNFEFHDYWDRVEEQVWKHHGEVKTEHIKTLGVLFRPKSDKEKGVSLDNKDLADGIEGSDGLIEKHQGDGFTGQSAVLTKSITNTEYEWLRQLKVDSESPRLRTFSSYPLSKRSENGEVREIEDLVRGFNLHLGTLGAKLMDLQLHKEIRETHQKPIMEKVDRILDIFDLEPEPEIKFIREGTPESSLKSYLMRPDEVSITELRVILGMLKAIKDYRWRGQVKWHRGGKILYVFKAKELFLYRGS